MKIRLNNKIIINHKMISIFFVILLSLTLTFIYHNLQNSLLFLFTSLINFFSLLFFVSTMLLFINLVKTMSSYCYEIIYWFKYYLTISLISMLNIIFYLYTNNKQVDLFVFFNLLTILLLITYAYTFLILQISFAKSNLIKIKVIENIFSVITTFYEYIKSLIFFMFLISFEIYKSYKRITYLIVSFLKTQFIKRLRLFYGDQFA